MAEGAIPYFRITGNLGHLSVSATWSNGCLMADPELMDLGDQLAREGLTFAEDPVTLVAGLDAPLEAFLTLAWCFDEITHATITLPSD